MAPHKEIAQPLCKRDSWAIGTKVLFMYYHTSTLVLALHWICMSNLHIQTWHSLHSLCSRGLHLMVLKYPKHAGKSRTWVSETRSDKKFSVTTLENEVQNLGVCSQGVKVAYGRLCRPFASSMHVCRQTACFESKWFHIGYWERPVVTRSCWESEYWC